VLDIKMRAVLHGMFPDLLYAITLFGVDSVEHQIERRVRFPAEAMRPRSRSQTHPAAAQAQTCSYG
jgi:hypothetical protein